MERKGERNYGGRAAGKTKVVLPSGDSSFLATLVEVWVQFSWPELTRKFRTVAKSRNQMGQSRIAAKKHKKRKKGGFFLRILRLFAATRTPVTSHGDNRRRPFPAAGRRGL